MVATAVPRSCKSRGQSTRLGAVVLESPSVSVRAPQKVIEEDRKEEVRSVWELSAAQLECVTVLRICFPFLYHSVWQVSPLVCAASYHNLMLHQSFGSASLSCELIAGMCCLL